MTSRRDILRLASLAIPGAAPSTRRVVLVELSGGMSHVDTFDFKENAGTPRDLDVREPVPGLYLSHRLFPRLSARMHRFAVVRSITTSADSHFTGQYLLQTGRPFDRASESWHGARTPACRVETRLDTLPRADTLSRPGFVSFHLNRSLPGPLTPGAVNQTPSPSSMGPVDRHRYGGSEVGAACAAARDLLASSAAPRYIHICHAGWDHHAGIWKGASNHYTQCRDLDAALSSLVESLAATRMLETTLVVAMSEFGRTPGGLNGMGGRDHHTACFPALFTGAGVVGGRILGRTDEEGERCVETGWRHNRQPTVEDVVATIASALGIDWKTGEVISEISR